MKKSNLVNKFIRGIFVFFDWFMILAGFTSIVYRPISRTFEVSGVLKFYTKCMLAICFLSIAGICLLRSERDTPSRLDSKVSFLFMVGCYFITLLTRWQQIKRQPFFQEKLNDYLTIIEDIRLLSRNPNIFTLPHLFLCLIGIQGALRSISSESMLFSREYELHNYHGCKFIFVLVKTLFKTFTGYIFIIMANGIFLMFVTLIACYDELHQCTKRISKDTKRLRCGQSMGSHQRVKFMRELQVLMDELISLRVKLYDMTVELSKHFELVLFLAILYWILQTTAYLMIASNGNPNPEERQRWNGILFSIFTGVYNIGYFCFLGEVLKRKSRISRSFWNFHLTNIDSQFDKTVDEFVSTGFVENLNINIFGVSVTMKLFFKILILVLLYAHVYMNFSKRDI